MRTTLGVRSHAGHDAARTVRWLAARSWWGWPPVRPTYQRTPDDVSREVRDFLHSTER